MDPRVLRSRRAILDTATTLFLRDGYVATTMDGIAEAAGVSKRTVYNNFADKEALFREVVLAASALAEPFAGEVADLLADPDDLEAALTHAARRLAAIATSPSVVRLRRLIIGEAHRFPDLAAEYYRMAPGRVIDAVAEAFATLGTRGRLGVEDPGRAAEQFAYLVVGAALDRAMFDGHDAPPDPERVATTATAGARAFLSAHAG